MESCVLVRRKFVMSGKNVSLELIVASLEVIIQVSTEIYQSPRWNWNTS